MWWYSLDCLNYFMIVDTFESMAYNYNYAAQMGVTCMNDQNQGDTPVMTDWSRLKNYLKSSLVKNPNANVQSLINDFMDAYFGAGATYMKQLLDSQRQWFTSLLPKTVEEINLGGAYALGHLRSSAWIVNKWQWTSNLNKSDKYPSSALVKQWMTYVVNAKTAINNDSALTTAQKTTLCNRVDLESLTARRVLVEIFNDTTYDANVNALYQFAKSLGMTKKGEGQTIN